ncbi:hypothetical protein [Sulfurimonas sp.]|uniref:hypothetical protein n=1 Tax=Sulfurimonas sp. TaxID=2022749 RepID=UPI00260DFA08|nr:hypothetical protein [Sulfurimonas sp.]MDD5157789.1 hypothetical protein [Sulfurimonas sp.]
MNTIKALIIVMLSWVIASANMEVKMNIKALYKDKFETLSEKQQNYIYDNMNKIKEITEAVLKQETKNLQKEKFIDEKNVIEFILNSDGSIGEINYIARSSERKFDNLSKRIIETSLKNYPMPKEATPIRMIFVYSVGKKFSESRERADSRPYIQIIQRGTSRFEHSMKEQVREFETLKDGFVNVNVNPQSCAEVSLLTDNNQKVNGGLGQIFMHYSINTEVPKGKYKLLVQTKVTCNVNIQYP